MNLNCLRNDRAAGDALGAGYEFGTPLPDGILRF